MPARAPRPQAATDLRADDELGARLASKRQAQARLGKPRAVKRRSVEEPDPELPRALDRLDSLPFVNGPVEAGQRRGAQSEPMGCASGQLPARGTSSVGARFSRS